MSLATLKRKSKIGILSGKDKNGFSIVGGYRNKGRIGETQERGDIRTLFKNTQPIGYGGCCGKYEISIIKPKINLNDSNIIKKPNLTTKGYIESRFINPTLSNKLYICGGDKCPPKWVKSIDEYQSSQGLFIYNKSVISSSMNSSKSIHNQSEKYKSNYSVCKKNGKCRIVYNHFKEKKGGVSYDEYLKYLLSNNCLPPPPCKKPFPFVINNPSGCRTDYATPEQAIQAGLLPKNWMNCSNTSNVFKKNPYCK